MGQAQQLATKVVFEAGAGNLLAVVEVFRPDEAHHSIDEHGPEAAGDGVGAGFERLLVHAVMGVGRERRALAGFKVQDVVAGAAVGREPAAAERLAGLVSLVEQRQGDAEAAVGSLGSGDRLKQQIDRRAGLKGPHLRGDVGQHAALHGNPEALAQGIDEAQQARGDGHVVARRIDADDGVAGAEQQAVEEDGCVTTRIFRAAAIRSCTRISLLTAATISGVSPAARAARRSCVASSESSQLRNSPTVSERSG